MSMESTATQEPRMTLKSLRRTLPCLLLLGTVLAGMQANAQTRSFEVVSIRQNLSQTGDKRQQLAPSPEGFRVTRVPLIMILMTAYTPSGGGLFVNNVENLPEWAKGENYDIDARISDADRGAWQDPKNQPAMLQAMLQSMLTDRFKLAVHRSTKEVSVYDLTTAKGGPKLTETKPDEPRPTGLTLPGGGVMVQEDGPGGSTAHLYNFSTSLLASLLTTQSDREIKDKTGLTGRYDMFIHKPARMAAPSAAPNGNTLPDPEPSMSDVVKDLGLKLEPAKEQVETLVIDHVERPSPN
jgi:bla regulator protein BlaR1